MTDPDARRAALPTRKWKKRKNPQTWEGMVKVQRNLNPPANTSVLITSRDGMIRYQGPADDAILRWFEDDEPKFYARATLRNTIIHIVRKHDGHTW